MTTTIRTATPEDVPQILVFIRAWQPTSVSRRRYSRLKRACCATVLAPSFLFLPDRRARGPSGGFALYFSITRLAGPARIYLEDIFVLSEFRGRGSARICSGRRRPSLSKGLQRMQWEVLDWNTSAIEFYRAMGAEFLDEWRNVRINGEALRRLSGRKDNSREFAPRSSEEENPRVLRAEGGCPPQVVRVIGGGLAGCEAALTAARLGCQVDLYEMRAMVEGSPASLRPTRRRTSANWSAPIRSRASRRTQRRGCSSRRCDGRAPPFAHSRCNGCAGRPRLGRGSR